MSIKPIDFHLTYANTVNESKTKQSDLNKLKDFNHSVQHQQQVEVKRNQKRITHSEESKGKTINNRDKKQQGGSDGESSEANHHQEKQSNCDSESSPKNCDHRGLKIDIMI
ncbi:hypothetical protein [Alkaliphilus transvaalensis]|uniref:hypothetical protein n=1 Tax=Alkaliphilus transvaalensis TaxID=114628 RepID=UPI00047B3796|nr:hypothetical protein [Alkaliphilus transvaalensis]